MEGTPEFTLLLEACRAAFEGRQFAVSALDRRVDWARFLRLARFHRVQGLVWQSLAGVGLAPETAAELAGDAQRIAETNLRTAVACSEILAAFDQAGVALIFVKGLTLAQLAYGTIATKSAIDIDILVSLDTLAGTGDLLQGLGFELEPAGSRNLAAMHRVRKESVWVNRDKRLQLDLHTRLADNPRLIPAVGMNSTSQGVDVAPAIRLPTLGTDELFAYLCVHGASSAWFRLKWITDLAALLNGQSPDELGHLYVQSQQLGAGRAPMQALLLADELYGSLRSAPTLRQRLRRDRGAAWLCRAALRQLMIPPEPVEPTSRALGTARIHLTQFALLPDWGFKAGELARQARASFG